MMYPKALSVMLALVLAVPSFASPVPVSGTFDIVSSPDILGIRFDSLPWSDTDTSKSVEIYPYVTDDFMYGQWHNLAEVTLNGQGYSVVDNGPAGGDLAVSIYNSAGDEILFAESTITLTFTDFELDVYLPEFTLARNKNIHFWIASDGSSYYSTYFIGRTGSPAMSAQDSIDAGNLARLAIPEPATIVILAAGTAFVLRRRKFRAF